MLSAPMVGLLTSRRVANVLRAKSTVSAPLCTLTFSAGTNAPRQRWAVASARRKLTIGSMLAWDASMAAAVVAVPGVR